MSIVDRIKGITNFELKTCMPYPISCKIELSTGCNFNCVYCKVGNTKNNKFMKEENVYTIVSKLYNSGVRHFGLFFMGEGTLHPNFNSICKTIKEKYPDIFLFLTTNGTSDLKESLPYLDSIKFSINYYDDKSFESNIRIKSKLNEILNNIKELVEYRNSNKIVTEISASSIFFNNPSQEEFVKKLKNTVDSFFYNNLQTQAGFISTSTKFEDINSEIIQVDKFPCYGMFTMANINVDGELCACRWDSSSEWSKFGSLIDNDFDVLWNCDKIQEYRRQHINAYTQGLYEEVNTHCLKCLRIKGNFNE